MASPWTSDNPTTGNQPVPKVSIVQKEIFPDSPAAYIPETQPRSLFCDYKVVNDYRENPNIYMLPIASPGQGAAFVQLAQPTLLWIADWTASRTTQKPIIPDPTPADPSWILLHKRLSPFILGLASDGVTPLYRISGVYIYGHLNHGADMSLFVQWPRPPWMENIFDRFIRANNIGTGILTEAVPIPMFINR